MEYYSQNLLILAVFNLVVGVARLFRLFAQQQAQPMIGGPVLMFFWISGILPMSAVLFLVVKKKLKLRDAVAAAYVIILIYIFLMYMHSEGRYDTLVNLGLMTIIFSTLSLNQCYRQENDWVVLKTRDSQILDIRVSESGQLFNPLVVGPHLEINSDIAEAVDHFVGAMKEMAPLELYVYCGSHISKPVRETAIEAFQEHFRDEERRQLRVLRQRTKRSMVLFCISMSIMFLWSRYNEAIGNSVIWTVLGNMGGFFLWEIGNTYFRHEEDFLELERIMICKEADITFL